MAELAAAYVQIIPSMKGVASGLSKELSGALGGMGPAVSKHANSWGASIKNTLGSAVKAVGAIGATAFAAIGATLAANLGSAISRVDTLNNFPRQMANMGYSAAEANESINKLSEGIQGLPTTLDGIVGTAQSLAPLTGSLAEATDLSLALNNAFLASGRGAADASRGMAQITQMFASGHVDMMSWRTLMETMPGQLDQLAKSMLGPSGNAQSLYDALQSGQISMKDFQNAIIDLNENGGDGFASFAEQAKSATGGIATSFTNVRTAISRGMANIIQAIGPEKFTAIAAAITGVINDISGAIVAFIEGADFSGLSSSIGGMLPVIGGLVGALGGLASQLPFIGQFFVGITGPVGIVIGLFAGLIASSSALRDSFGAVVYALSSSVQQLAPTFQQVFDLIGQVLGQLGDALAPIIVQLSGGLLQAVSALTPVVNQIVGILRQLVSMIMPVVEHMLAAIVPIIGQAAGVIANVITALGPLISQLTDFLMPIIESLLPVVTSAIDGILGVLQPALATIQAVIDTVMAAISGDWSAAWEGIKSIVSGVWETIKAFISAVVNQIKSAISGALGVIKSIFTSGWNALTGIVAAAWSMVKGAVSAGIEGAVSLVRGLPGKVAGALGNLGSTLYNSGRALLQGFMNGIMSMFSSIKSKVSSGLASVRSLFPFSPAKEGPFSGKGWVLYSGLSIGEAMAEGISRATPQAVGAARSLNALTQEALDQVTGRSLAVNTASTAPNLYSSGSPFGGQAVNITVNIRPEDLAGIRTVEDFVVSMRRQAVMQGVGF